jgi:predicted nuclease of predicted toxin-antitoxin system
MGWRRIDHAISDEAFADFERDFKRKARFLIDESLGVEAARVIRALGWNAVYVGDVGLGGKSDEDVFAFGWKEDRIILTHDEDFLDDRRFPYHRNPGVIVLPGATGETPGLINAVSGVLRLVGPYREANRGVKIQITEDGIWSIKGLTKGGVRAQKKRVRFGRPTEHLTASSERIAAEQKWYVLTGRVVELRAEADGDLQIVLADASGDKPGSVVAQIPAKPRRSTFISRAGKNSRDQTNPWREDCRMNQ